MSGVFGIVDVDNPSHTRSFLRDTVSSMSHFEWYESKTWVAPDATAALGRMDIGILNRDQPAHESDDGRVVLVMAGELYHNERTQAALKTLWNLSTNASDPELALSAYQTWGEDFAAHLEGAFTIAVYDQTRQHLILTNDRFGLYPTYYAVKNGRFAFAPEVKGILCARFVERMLNMAAVAEYFRFQQVLEEKTFHNDVRILSYGSVGRFDIRTGQWTLRHYWDLDHVRPLETTSYEEIVSEASRLLRCTVERHSADSLRPCVFLSGGLDSRTLLGLITPRTPAPVTATFGQRNCRDVYYAEKIAKAKGSRHYWFEFQDGCWIQENVNLHLKLTEGFHHWVHMHGITMLPELRNIVDYNLTGWDGYTVMRHPPQFFRLGNFAPDQAASVVHAFNGFVNIHTWPGINEPEEQMLYVPEVQKQMTGLAFQSFAQEYRRYEKFDLPQRWEYFFFINHCFRMTFNMNTVTRSHIEVRFPFFDYDLVDFMYSLNWDIRGHSIYRDVISRVVPDLALIPFDKEEYLPTTQPTIHNLHALSVRARRRLGLYPDRPTLYADYENYLRHELRPWAESILYDRRTEERGITNPAFVRSLMERHMAGHEEWTIGKIAPLITFEMLMRMYFD